MRTIYEEPESASSSHYSMRSQREASKRKTSPAPDVDEDRIWDDDHSATESVFWELNLPYEPLPALNNEKKRNPDGTFETSDSSGRSTPQSIHEYQQYWPDITKYKCANPAGAKYEPGYWLTPQRIQWGGPDYSASQKMILENSNTPHIATVFETVDLNAGDNAPAQVSTPPQTNTPSEEPSQPPARPEFRYSEMSNKYSSTSSSGLDTNSSGEKQESGWYNYLCCCFGW